MRYSAIKDNGGESDLFETASEFQPLSNQFDEDELVSSFIISDNVEPTTLSKVCDILKAIVLFPTKITVICGVIAGLWLSFCLSVVSVAVAFHDQCPGNPAVPQTMFVHATAWVVVCVYTLVRLLWVELRKDRLPEFKIGCCCLIHRFHWRKEFTYFIDGLGMTFLLGTFVAQMVEVTLVQSGRVPVIYTFDTELIKRCETCCLAYVMRVAVSQIILSNVAHTMLIMAYLHLFGVLSTVRELVCKKDVARKQDETATLM